MYAKISLAFGKYQRNNKNKYCSTLVYVIVYVKSLAFTRVLADFKTSVNKETRIFLYIPIRVGGSTCIIYVHIVYIYPLYYNYVI